MPGVIREVVIELSGRLGIPVEEAELLAAFADDADEIFLTSSIRGVMGLSRFVNRELAAGPATGEFRQAWNTEVNRECGIGR